MGMLFKALLILSASGRASLGNAVFYIEPSRTEAQYREKESLPFSTKSKGSPIRIGVIDSGLDLGLAQREGVTYSEKELAPFLSFAGGTLADDLGHGTGILLQLAAKANGFGITGLVPEASVYPLKIGTAKEFNEAAVPLQKVIDAFDLAAREKIQIVVLSLSNVESRWPKAEMKRAIDKHKSQFLVLAAAGNDAWSLDYGPKCAYVPICLEAPNLLKVGASDESFSNRGKVVDMVVPSATHQWRLTPFPDGKKGFEIQAVKSTSVAVPKVAALAARLFQENPGMNPIAARRKLVPSAPGPSSKK